MFRASIKVQLSAEEEAGCSCAREMPREIRCSHGNRLNRRQFCGGIALCDVVCDVVLGTANKGQFY